MKDVLTRFGGRLKDIGILHTSKVPVDERTYLRADYTTENVRRDTRFAVNNQSKEQQSQAKGPEVRDHSVNLYSRDLNSAGSTWKTVETVDRK